MLKSFLSWQLFLQIYKKKEISCSSQYPQCTNTQLWIQFDQYNNCLNQIKSNQFKSFITRRLIFLQYKYHIEKYNPREGKLIWGARFS